MIRTLNDLIIFYFSKHFIFSVRDPIRDLICDPVRDPMWSDPGFVDAEKKNDITVNLDIYASHLSK